MTKNWDISDILLLKESHTISIRNIISIIEQFNSLDDFLNSKHGLVDKFNPPEIFKNGKLNAEKNRDEILEKCDKAGVRIISFLDDEYPFLLKNISYPPVVLFVKGSLQVSDAESISIVGTRTATSYGMLATERFVEEFVRHKLIITSGLANGIDTKSHLETIKNKGVTYAVIASGIDEIKPVNSHKNAEKIIDSGGAVISEYACGTKALPAYFPQRNRIISGISRATLVIESAEKGGSLITAGFAFDEGRDVFALPGVIFSEKSKGTNALIAKDMAKPAISPEYVLKELGIEVDEKKIDFKNESLSNLTVEGKKLLNAINHEPRQVDDIAAAAGVNLSTALVNLLELEFNGLVRQLPGKYYIKI